MSTAPVTGVGHGLRSTQVFDGSPSATLAHAQDLFDAAPDAYVITDATGVVTEVNDMARKLIGPVADRLVPLEQFVESHGRHAFRVTLGQSIPRGGRRDWHLRLEPRPDQVLDVVASMSVGSNSAGQTELRWLLRPAEPMRGRDVFAHGMRQLTRRLAMSSDIEELLSTLCDRGVEILDATACGVLLADVDGNLQTVAASDEEVEALELFQMQHAEGPCFDAFRFDEVVVVERLNERADQWPGFVARALGQQLRSLAAVPMRVRGRVIGALTFLRARPGTFSDSDVMAALALANFAAFGISSSRALDHSKETVQQLQHALDSRILVEQAKGMLAERVGVSPSVAFQALRRHARHHQRPMRDVCRDVIDNMLEVDALDVGTG